MSIYKNFKDKIIQKVSNYISKAIRYEDSSLEQIHLMQFYRSNLQKSTFPKYHEIGFRKFSQTNEDGIILYIFSIIGVKCSTAVEVCVGNGLECNVANLVVNHGWHALMFDGSKKNITRAKHYYESHPRVLVFPPKMVSAWVTAENIDELISFNGFSGEIDLLSIDVDGVDYWIWSAIKSVNPRVVIIEAQTFFGPDKKMTIKYNSDFLRNGGVDYGASVAALVTLGGQLGYRLVATNMLGYNLFFLRNDIDDKNVLPTLNSKDIFSFEPDSLRKAREAKFEKIDINKWVEV